MAGQPESERDELRISADILDRHRTAVTAGG